MFLYPKHYLISDEVYYAQQGIMFFQDQRVFEIEEWSDGQLSLRNTDVRNYKIGTGLVTGLVMKTLGNKAQYLVGIVGLLISILSIGYTLKYLGYSPFWAALLAISPVNGLLCRTVMSDLPSMALSAIFVFFLIRNKRTIYENIIAASILGISFFFRETNAVFLGLLSLPFLLEKNNYKLLYLIIALVSGIFMAYLTVNVFHEPLFSRDLGGLDFSLANIPNNLFMYALALIVMIPLGGIFVFAYKGKYALLFKSATAMLVTIYLLYAYNGFNESGAKGALLNARFMLPLFPLVVIATAHIMEKWKYYTPRILTLVAITSIISFASMNTVGYLQNERQEELVSVIRENNKGSIYTADMESNMLKYANYFTGARVQIPFDRVKMSEYLSTGGNIAVIYSQSIGQLETWLDFPTPLAIEEKEKVTLLDNSSICLLIIGKQR